MLITQVVALSLQQNYYWPTAYYRSSPWLYIACESTDEQEIIQLSTGEQKQHL